MTWRSKKQHVVSRSSAESEYRALALGMCEGVWIQRLLKELRVELDGTISMLSDSLAAISIAKNQFIMIELNTSKLIGISSLKRSTLGQWD